MDVEYSTLDVEYSTLDMEYSTLDVEYSTAQSSISCESYGKGTAQRQRLPECSH